ncbi:protein DDI1 homolog 2 isoform X4 [Bos mutus]|nr:Regulatory solute carrier protein family 1 member 1 [Bos mutus]
MSSLPTSDGFNHQAHPPGLSPEIGNPPSLAHSVSASVSPIQPSDPDSIEPKAVKALKASAELQITSEQKEHLPPQDLSDCAPSADSAPANQSPAMPLQNSLEEAIVADHVEKSAERSTQGLKSHLHTRQEASLSVTTTGMQEPQRLTGEKVWHPEYQDPSQVSGLQQHEEPRNEHEVIQQSASHDQDHPCHTGDLELLGERQQSSAGLEAAMKGDRLQQNVDLPGTGKDILPSGCLGCSNSETLMEVDIVEQSLVAVPNSGGQNTNVKNSGASDLILDNPLMEIETSKCNPSSEISSNSISTQDLQLLESNVEMSETSKECGDHPSSLISLCGSCQPSVESSEESCSSLTAALKELHELLVISSKPASENTSEEGICQSETAEGQTGIKDLSERWTQNEHLTATQSEQCSQVSSHQAIPIAVKTEELTDTSADTGVEDGETVNLRGPGDGLLTDKEGVPKSKESVNKSSSVTVASAEASNQLHCTLGVEISPRLLADEEDTLNQTCEQTESSSPACILVKDLGQGTQNPVTDRPEAREHVCPEAAGPLLGLEPSTSHPSPSPSFLAPLIFPAADIDRILRAGFTLQEALGALHRVGGNADLALLVLLAKNIVVPT